ncbi:MAG: sugar ABC transporter permease [Spirochaetaceae bacterium]|jgi:raffinose/stachyose/melibiose transport system permease protein|nr:sugar ABC transporter permease [Spirochaetaceae bacterium]
MNKINSLKQARERAVNITAAVCLAPVLLFLAVSIVYPIIDSFVMSTVKWNGLSPNREPVGLANWAELVKDQYFWQAFRNNIVVMFISLATQGVLDIALATFLDITGKKGLIFKIVWFLPYLISSVAIGILFKFALDATFGIFGSISRLMGGGSVDLLGNPNRALFAVMGVVSWQYTPFYMILYLAAYGTIPVELYEAASIDGATRGAYFWKVSLPLLRPTIVSAATVSIIGSLKYFDLVYVMTGGGPGSATELMATLMYKTTFVRKSFGYGAALACGMFILITLVALVTVYSLNKKAEDYA